eukprot:11763010-Alexandrium_andersonii.AAC.1
MLQLRDCLARPLQSMGAHVLPVGGKSGRSDRNDRVEERRSTRRRTSMQPRARPSPQAGLEAIQLPRAMSRERLDVAQSCLAWRSRAKP